MSFSDSNAFTIGTAAGPAWFSSQTDKTWVQPLTSSTTIFSVAQTPVGNNSSNGAGIFAWSGGAAGTYNGHDGMFVWGGGHNDWLGNEVFFVDLVDQKCLRIKDRSNPLSGGDGGTQWGDGNPRVPHSYRHLVYTPGFLWCMCQMAGSLSGGSDATVWRLNLSTLVWTKVLTNWPGLGTPFCECGSLYSPSRGLIYAVTQFGEVWQFNPSTLAMSQIGNQLSGSNLGNAIAFWDTPGLLLYRKVGGTFHSLNVANGGAGWTNLTTSGTFGASESYPGLVWHETSKKFLGWGHRSNRANVFTLAPANPSATTYAQAISGTWTAATVTPSGSNAVTPVDYAAVDSGAATGIFDRFEVLTNFQGSGRDALVLVSSSTTPPYVYKLPAAGI